MPVAIHHCGEVSWSRGSVGGRIFFVVDTISRMFVMIVAALQCRGGRVAAGEGEEKPVE